MIFRSSHRCHHTYVLLSLHFMYEHNIGDAEHILIGHQAVLILFVFVEEGEKIVIVKLHRGHTFNLAPFCVYWFAYLT